MVNREELIQMVEPGRKAKYLFFWGHTPGRGNAGPWVLSQWFAASFVVDGQRYPTAEHYMMAGKAWVMQDLEARDLILTAGSAGKAKALGRGVRGFDEELWEANRMRLVVEANLHKFGQNQVLRDYLLSTGSKILVEASPKDRIWGIGLAADDPRASNPRLWCGENLLGFALMEVRKRLAS